MAPLKSLSLDIFILTNFLDKGESVLFCISCFAVFIKNLCALEIPPPITITSGSKILIILEIPIPKYFPYS